MSKCPPRRVGVGHTPHARVVALLPKAGPDGGALLLDDSTFVGDGLGSAHITDELLHWPCLSFKVQAGGLRQAYRKSWCWSRGPHLVGAERFTGARAEQGGWGWLLGQQGGVDWVTGWGDPWSWGVQWWLILGKKVQ